MTKKNMMDLINDRIQGIQAEIDALDGNSALKDNTKGNMKSRMNKDRNNLSILLEVVDQVKTEDVKLTKSHAEAFNNWIEPAKLNQLVVKAGDSIVEMMINNPKLTYERIQKAAEKAGLKITGGKIV